MRAVLCIGLRNARQVTALAPRLIKENGEIVMGEPLHFTTGLPKPGQRVTYLASVLRAPGSYDCEVAEDGTIIPSMKPLAEVPEFAQRILTERAWIAPGSSVSIETKPEPARRRP